MDRWYERPGFPLMIAFLIGAALAGIASLIVIVVVVGGDGDGNSLVRATVTASASPTGGAPATPTSGPLVTPTPSSLTDPKDVLETFIQDSYGQEHIGDCPQTVQPGRTEIGVCSTNLYESDEFLTYIIGAPLSEAFGEVILRRNEDETWSVTFLAAPPLGETITLNQDAFVYAVGNCLNFRAAPSLSADVRSCQADGTRAQVVEGPQQADGHVWWRLDGFGWASEQFLAPVTE